MTPATATTFTTLLRLRLRRDRFQLAVWLGSILLLVLFSAASLGRTYDTEAGRAGLVRLATANPTVLALRGAPQGTTPGAVLAFEMMGYLGLMVGLLNTFLAVRHSRAEEDTGRAELIGATLAGRVTPVVATLVEGVLVALGVAAAVTVGLVTAGLPAGGSVTAGLALAACGLTFLGVGLACAQLFSTGRAANGWAASLVGLSFVLRAVGDAAGVRAADGLSVRPAWPAWLSPIGWAEATSPYAGDSLGPALLALAAAAVLVAAALALQARRDLGAGLVPDRAGRATAGPLLRGPVGLAWRLQRGTVFGWAAGGVAMGLLAGQLGPLATQALEENPEVGRVLAQMSAAGQGGALDLFLAAMLGILGLVVSGCMVQIVMRLRQEEALGTAEATLATRTGRLRWLGSHLAVGLGAAVGILLLSGLVAAATLAGHGEGRLAGEVVAGALAQLPAALVYLGLLALVFAFAPRATVPAGWGLFALGAFLGQFGTLLDVPRWARELAPSAHIPALPLTTADWSGAWWMLGLAAALTAVTALSVRRRDLALG